MNIFTHRLGENKKGKILFIHGFLSTHKSMLEIGSHFEDEYECLYIDLPFHGKSGGLKRDEMAKWLSDFISKEKINFAYAYSMGGRVLLESISKYKVDLEKIILESVGIGQSNSQIEKDKRVALENSMLDMMNGDEFYECWYQLDIFTEIVNTNGFEEHKKNCLENNLSRMREAFCEYRTSNGPCFLEKLDGLRVLYIHGELDKKYTQMGQSYLDHSNALSLELAKVDGASHNCHLMNPSKIKDLVSSYL